jgi:hypothetical protein
VIEVAWVNREKELVLCLRLERKEEIMEGTEKEKKGGNWSEINRCVRAILAPGYCMRITA